MDPRTYPDLRRPRGQECRPEQPWTKRLGPQREQTWMRSQLWVTGTRQARTMGLTSSLSSQGPWCGHHAAPPWELPRDQPTAHRGDKFLAASPPLNHPQCLLGRSLPLATCPKTPAQAVWGNVPCQTPGLGTSLRKPPKMEEGQACHPSGQGKGAQVTTWPGWGCWS